MNTEYKITKNLSILLSFVVIIFFSNCSNQNACIPSPDISDIKIELKIDRLDERLRNVNSKEELKILLDENIIFSELFLSRSQYPFDSMIVNRFYSLLTDPFVDTLWQETENTFGNLEDIILQYDEAFRRIKYYYPEFTPPRIQTVFTGLTHDMYVSDSLIIIGLDFYLGESASYKPNNIPEYILKRYRKENIVPNSLLILSNQFSNADLDDKTLIADMIYYGKAYYFSKQMLPCVPDSIFLGYSPKEMNDINRSQEIIWASFIENEALFDTNHFIKDKFISERPKTLEIGENCPGRIGRWIGWEIVKAYMENADHNLTSMMHNNNSRILFEQSGFKPRSN